MLEPDLIDIMMPCGILASGAIVTTNHSLGETNSARRELNKSRREFLKQAALLLTGLGAATISDHGLILPSHAKGGYKLGSFTGDDFTLGHKIRDGKPPKLPTSVSEKVDFVIVGGGLSGLASAHYLRDSNFLLLEQYNDLGGHARGGSYNGIGYSYGAAYLSTLEGAIGELVDTLGLKPLTLDDSKDAWYQNGKWLRGTAGSDNIIFDEFKRLKSDHKDFFGRWDGLYSELKELPELMKLDDVLMDDVLKGYDASFVSLVDNFLKSALNAGVKSISALSGLSTLEDVLNKTYLLPGGNPALATELVKRLNSSHGDRLKPGAFVWDIKIKDDGAIVTYSLRDGSMHVAECKHVLIAIPHMVTARIAKNLNDKAKAAMFRFRYGAYLVANVLCRKRVFDATYDNFLPVPFEIADITAAETPYMMNGSYKADMGSVLTCYSPYEPGSTGRTMLYQGDKKRLAAGVMTQLYKLAPELKDHVDEVILSRWGHAMAITKPQYFKYVGELQTLESDSYSFAHSSAHGLPSAEAAVQGAKHAAEKAKKLRVSSKPIYSISALALAVVVLNLMAPAFAADKTTGPTKYNTRTIPGTSSIQNGNPSGFSVHPNHVLPTSPKPETLIWSVSNRRIPIPVFGAEGVAAVANVGSGEQVKGTYLAMVHGIGPGHDCGLVAGDMLLMIDKKVTETPELTTQLVTEYSGIKTTVRYARKIGNVLEVKETEAYWTITSAAGSTMPSAGYDSMQTMGGVSKLPAPEVSTEELEDYMIEIVNNDRALNGDLPKVFKSETLSAMARKYADDMVARKFFSHKDPDGNDMTARGAANGITGHLAENISLVRNKVVEPRELVKRCQKTMMNEPVNVPGNHRANILDKEQKCMGVGVAILPEGGIITVQEFSHDELP